MYAFQFPYRQLVAYGATNRHRLLGDDAIVEVENV